MVMIERVINFAYYSKYRLLSRFCQLVTVFYLYINQSLRINFDRMNIYDCLKVPIKVLLGLD